MLISVLTDVLNVRLTVRTQVLIAKHSHLTKKGKEEMRQEFPLVHVSLFQRRYLRYSERWSNLQIWNKNFERSTETNTCVFVLCVRCVFLSVPVCTSGCKQLSVKQRQQPWR
jgi:hypothetical protein